MLAAGREILPTRTVFAAARFETVARWNGLESLMMPEVVAAILRHRDGAYCAVAAARRTSPKAASAIRP